MFAALTVVSAAYAPTIPALLPQRPAVAFAPQPAVAAAPLAFASTRTAAAAAARRSPEPQALLSVSKVLISIPTLYALMSVNEYCTHRWYQHEEFNRDHAFQRFCQRIAYVLRRRPMVKADGRNNMIKIKGGGHVEHHAETYDDMSLKKDAKWRQTKAAASLDSDICARHHH